MMSTRPPSNEPILAAEDVVYAIDGKAILDGISIRFYPSTLTILVGPNGAGKSTLLAALAGDLAGCRSQVTLTGKALSRWRARSLAQVRSVMTQDHAVRFAFSVQEVVAMGRLPHPPNPSVDEQICLEAITSADVLHLQNRDVQTLSGGEVSRTAFARALAQQTAVVFLDEPTAALDLFHQERLLQELRKLADHGACVIAVLHDLNLASAYADRIAMLENGRLVAEGTPQEVFRKETIEKVYRQPILVIDHPTRGVPLIVSDGIVERVVNS